MPKLLTTLGAHKLFCLATALSSLALYGAFGVLDPLVNKVLIDRGIIGHHIRLFAILATAVIMMGVIFRIGILLHMLLVRRLQNAVTISLTMRMLKVYYDTACPEVAGSSVGYLTTRIYDEPAQVSAGVVAGAVGLCISIATLLAGLAVSIYLAWRLTAVLLVAVPLLIWIAKKYQPRIRQAFARENEEEALTRGTIGQVVEAYKTVKLFSLEKSVFKRVYDQLAQRLGLGYQTVRASALYETGSGILLSLAEALVLVGAAYEVINGRMSMGGLFGYMGAFWKIMNAGVGLIAQFSTLAKVSGQVDRLLAFETLPKDATEEDACGNAGTIELEAVALAYGDRTVLEDVTLAIAPQERLLIVGPNGSGKSTLSNVITGFVRPTRGSLKRPRRDRIAAMLTPFHFIPGSLRDNADFTSLTKVKQDVFATLVKEFELTDKCEVDLALTFSQGEQKKAQLIMTLLKEADLYLFDEPLANLDLKSKITAMELILHYTRGNAAAVIMHGDDQFHHYFDRIISMRDGIATSSTALLQPLSLKAR